jgi:hypothetical protein
MATVRHINYFPQCVQSYEAFLARTTGIATMTMSLEQAMAFFLESKNLFVSRSAARIGKPTFCIN